MKLTTSAFGSTADGRTVQKYILTNSHGHSISVMNWGANLLDVQVPDRQGRLANVNLSFPSLQPYLDGHPYFGATVGRFCNRIAYGRFTIDGKEYQVTINHGKHHLHGGICNFTYQFWEAETFEENDRIGVRFHLTSPDGQEGYPGTVNAMTEYTWNDVSEMRIAFTATSDAPTHVNLTNHSYWNLAGAGSGSALQQVAEIDADQFLDVDQDLIPTGALNRVDETALDFRRPTPLGARIDQLPATKGYDHCFVVRGELGQLRPAARVFDPQSGRVLEIETTQPGMQLYTANHLAGDASSNHYGPHEAFCLETQHFPDSPNHASFPSTLLRPGNTLHETTLHRFSILDE